jgi:hypothetical protein
MLDGLFPDMYSPFVIAHPSFSDTLRANISPQFQRGELYALAATRKSRSLDCFAVKPNGPPSQDPEILLDSYRYEHAIFASKDLGILTAWVQAEHAIVALKTELIPEYEEWAFAMRELEVLYEIV